MPLGGVAISEAIAATFADRPYPGGLTYSGHPLACAAAVATIRAMEDDGIVEHAAALGEEVFAPGLADAGRAAPVVGEVRGAGAFWAVELVADRETREPLAPYGGSSPAMAAVVAACKQARACCRSSNYNRIHLVPPLTTTAGRGARGGRRSSTRRSRRSTFLEQAALGVVERQRRARRSAATASASRPSRRSSTARLACHSG